MVIIREGVGRHDAMTCLEGWGELGDVVEREFDGSLMSFTITVFLAQRFTLFAHSSVILTQYCHPPKQPHHYLHHITPSTPLTFPSTSSSPSPHPHPSPSPSPSQSPFSSTSPSPPTPLYPRTSTTASSQLPYLPPTSSHLPTTRCRIQDTPWVLSF